MALLMHSYVFMLVYCYAPASGLWTCENGRPPLLDKNLDLTPEEMEAKTPRPAISGRTDTHRNCCTMSTVTSSNLDGAVSKLTKAQYALLQRVDQLTSELESAATTSRSSDVGLYASKLSNARDRIVAASSALKSLQARISKVVLLIRSRPTMQPFESEVRTGLPITWTIN